jgi:hypothetical protein
LGCSAPQSSRRLIGSAQGEFYKRDVMAAWRFVNNRYAIMGLWATGDGQVCCLIEKHRMYISFFLSKKLTCTASGSGLFSFKIPDSRYNIKDSTRMHYKPATAGSRQPAGRWALAAGWDLGYCDSARRGPRGSQPQAQAPSDPPCYTCMCMSPLLAKGGSFYLSLSHWCGLVLSMIIVKFAKRPAGS